MAYLRSSLLRFLAEAIVVGLLVGAAIIWWQSNTDHSSVDSYAQAVNKAAPAVVNIYSRRSVPVKPDSRVPMRFFQPHRQRLEASLGSGVIVSSKGYILTSYHVIQNSDVILVALMDGREASASIVGVDPATDLALLQIHLDNLPQITLADSPVKVGDVVLAIGNPLGLGQTVSMGIVSAKGRSHLGIATFENFIQTDAAINRGNSGGALVDTDGKLVGINTAILSSDGRWQGIGFATPAAIARQVMQDLIQYGHVIRGYVGVSVRNITPELASKLGNTKLRGSLITGIARGGPAARAGVRPGDVLLGINKTPIRGGYAAMNRVAGHRPGDKLTLNLWRAGKRFSLEVTVGERPLGMDK